MSSWTDHILDDPALWPPSWTESDESESLAIEEPTTNPAA